MHGPLNNKSNGDGSERTASSAKKVRKVAKKEVLDVVSTILATRKLLINNTFVQEFRCIDLISRQTLIKIKLEDLQSSENEYSVSASSSLDSHSTVTSTSMVNTTTRAGLRFCRDCLDLQARLNGRDEKTRIAARAELNTPGVCRFTGWRKCKKVMHSSEATTFHYEEHGFMQLSEASETDRSLWTRTDGSSEPGDSSNLVVDYMKILFHVKDLFLKIVDYELEMGAKYAYSKK
jgi:hypothetical protein